MKRFSTLVVAGALVFGLASCDKNKDNGDYTPEGQKTYAKLTFKEAGLRADSEGQVNAAGVGSESLVANAYLFVGGDAIPKTMHTVAGFTATEPNEAQFESQVFEYSGPTGSLPSTGLVVNYAGLNASNFDADFKVGIDKLANLTDDTGFTMSTATGVSQTIEADVKATDVNDTKNTLNYIVERVVSKAQVSEKEGGLDVKMADATDTNVKYPGTVEDKRYGVAGSALEVYLFGDNAGERVMSDDGNGLNIYKDYESAIEGVALTTFDAQNKFDVRRPLSKVSDGTLVTKSTDSDWNTLYSLPIVHDAKYASESNTNGIFFLENSLPVISGKGQADYADITYLSITAKFTPSDDSFYKLAADLKSVEKAKAADINSDREETVKVSETWVNSLPTEKKDALTSANKLVNKNTSGTGAADWELTMTVEAGSFFYGTSTKKLYTTLQASRIDGNKESKLYKAGKMLWRIPANKEKATTADFYANLDTRRNNIYSVEIQEITGLGFNYDVRDPENPNAPKPDPEDNPDEPTPDDKDPVDPTTTNVNVKATVLHWNLVHRKVNL